MEEGVMEEVDIEKEKIMEKEVGVKNIEETIFVDLIITQVQVVRAGGDTIPQKIITTVTLGTIIVQTNEIGIVMVIVAM